MQNNIAEQFSAIVESARRISEDIGQIVEEVLATGVRNPLSPDEARSLLTKVVEEVRAGTARRKDQDSLAVLERDIEGFIEQVMMVRSVLPATTGSSGSTLQTKIELKPLGDIEVRPVKPSPVFHEREIPVFEGFVKTRDIKIWEGNERIDIHLNQFRQVNRRAPTDEELLSIMLGDLQLQGVSKDDQFLIKQLARSIAVNGVRKPPIIDLDGTLLDGNRRVSACYYILNSSSDVFSAQEKKRVEQLQVWQLTEHATDEDRKAVIVSMNFEPDYKQDWPEYVKAHKIYEEWQTMLALEPGGSPSAKKQREIKQGISRSFALSSNEVTRYIKMVTLAEEFEDYHVGERNRDHYEVKHRANSYFQYFDELGKGQGAGGVYWSLNQDEAFKHLVYDLLYEGKFRNWDKIRDLKYIYPNGEALDYLHKAREENDLESAQDIVDDACGLARSTRAVKRKLGANTRIGDFVKWFKDLPVKVFDRDEPGAITKENLEGLREVLQLVDQHLPGHVNTNNT